MTAGAVVLTPEVAGAGAELAEAAELAGVTIGEAAAPVADGAELGVAATGADPVEAGAELADEVAAA